MNTVPTILIIDSDRQRIERLKSALSEKLPGTTPVLAASVADALALAHRRSFAYIIVGPIEEGEQRLEALRSLRAAGVKAHLILIVNSVLAKSSKVLHDIGVSAVVPLDGAFADTVAERIQQLARRKPPARRLTLRGRSHQNVDLIKITAGTLYHEISNPLMTILGMTELILDNGRPVDPEIARKVEAIRESAGRIQETLNRLINIDEPAIRDTASGQLIDPDRSRLNHKVLP